MPASKRRRPRKRQYGTGAVSKQGTNFLARLPRSLGRRQRLCSSLAEADAWIAAEIRAAESGHGASGETTVLEWAGRWLETSVIPVRSPSTARGYRIALGHLAPVYSLPLDRLRPSDLQQVASSLAGAVNASYVAWIVGVWRRCLDAAVDDELVPRNPARRLSLPSGQRPVPRRGWTPAEVRRLWAGIRGERFEVAFALLLGSGLRLGEVLGLHWRDVDLEGRRAWIGPQFTNGRWRDAPKGKNRHWIPLPAPVLAALIRARDARAEGAELVVAGVGNRPARAETVRAHLRALCLRIGVTVLSPHAARHGLASRLLDKGVGPADIASLLGHASAATTLSQYSHGQRSADELSRLVEGYLSGDETDST